MKAEHKPIVEFRNISKNFDGFNLENINLDIYPGEVHVLVGENGSGKSTLMKLLSGWFPQDSGELLLKGKSIVFKSMHEARKIGISYMHQEIQCFDNLTVAENLFMGELQSASNIPGLLDLKKLVFNAKKVFDELGINSLSPSQPLGKFGFAEKQIVFAVKSYISNARIMIFDEPSAAMLQTERDILFEIISRLKKTGKAIFYISHRLDEIARVGDRVSVMQRGKIIGTAPCNTVNNSSIINMMIGDVHKERYPKISSSRGRIVLSVSNLIFKPILNGVSFDLRQGEVLGITGLMGSGRTLLANCLFGLVKPTSGEILIDGRITNFNHPKEAMANGLSLIPEDRIKNGIFSKHDLQNNMTSATLRRFVNRIFLNKIFMSELTREYVDILKIKPGKQNDLIGRYSGGNQQKVMLGKWLMNRSMVYIMDEPTRGIDPASRIDIYNVMNDLTSKGAAILFISSEIEETIGMSDRILVLAGGKIAKEFKREEATKEDILSAATKDD